MQAGGCHTPTNTLSGDIFMPASSSNGSFCYDNPQCIHGISMLPTTAVAGQPIGATLLSRKSRDRSGQAPRYF